MALWGRADNTAITGTASITLANTNVVGVGTAFTTAVKVGQMIDLGTSKFVIKVINSDTSLAVAPAAGTARTAQPVLLSAIPRYLDDTKAVTEVSLVTTAEANDANNKILGVTSPGWTAFSTYVNSLGATRRKTELLVAMKS